MKTYRGTPTGTVIVLDSPNATWRTLLPRFDLRNHSPTGFAWGYGGSGPAQLALAILADLHGDTVALRFYQTFKDRVIAALPQDQPFTLTADAIEEAMSPTGPARPDESWPEAQEVPGSRRIGDTAREGLALVEEGQRASGPSVMPEIVCNIPDTAWQPIGDPDDPASRLLATIVIGNARMHAEAYAATTRDHPSPDEISEPIDSLRVPWQEQVFTGACHEVPEEVAAAVGVDGPWQTTTINGKEYVVIITPFCN